MNNTKIISNSAGIRILYFLLKNKGRKVNTKAKLHKNKTIHSCPNKALKKAISISSLIK